MNTDKFDVDFIKKHVPGAEQLLLGDKRELLDALDDVLVDKGRDSEGDYNALGLEGQAVYDDIYEFA
ncbi:MAG: hypothetical protein LBN22_03980 [Clostridiales Family XIII bacterium]|jgi:hypothetical protein|nr:hypothetical protein [Clostridiales Family XIII bacterium]